MQIHGCAGDEGVASVHCAIAVYLWRCGEDDAALAHLAAAAEASQSARLRATILRATLLFSAPDAARDNDAAQNARERAAREAPMVVEQAAMLAAAGASAASGMAASGLWAMAHLRVLRARCILSLSDAPDAAQLDYARGLLLEALSIADGALSDPPLQAEVMSLLGETWLQLGDSEEALKWAEKAHARAGLLGDHWLHSRVLRSLERLLLRFPEKAKKAQAALTIRTARAKAAAQATEQAIGSANHQKVRAWRIRWQ